MPQHNTEITLRIAQLYFTTLIKAAKIWKHRVTWNNKNYCKYHLFVLFVNPKLRCCAFKNVILYSSVSKQSYNKIVGYRQRFDKILPINMSYWYFMSLSNQSNEKLVGLLQSFCIHGLLAIAASNIGKWDRKQWDHMIVTRTIQFWEKTWKSNENNLRKNHWN